MDDVLQDLAGLESVFLSPFLEFGEIKASFHSPGSSLLSSDGWNNCVTGTDSSAAKIRMRVGILSGSEALLVGF